MTNNTQYGPWIAFNPGYTPPDDDVMVQVQLLSEARSDVEHARAVPSKVISWNIVSAYRIVKQPVRGQLVFYGMGYGSFSSLRHPMDTHRVAFSTNDGVMIPGTYTGPDGATIKIEAL